MKTAEISSWIAALASPHARERERAARSIYDAGAAAARAAALAWREDADLAHLFNGEPTVGVAVQPEHFEKIRRACGMPKLAAVPPDQDAEEFELHFSGAVSLDVLTTSQPHGPGAIARFLDRRGEGIQQVELPVTDVNRAVAVIKERFSTAPVYAEPRPGADGSRVNFFLLPIPAENPSATGAKILIELVEAASDRK